MRSNPVKLLNQPQRVLPTKDKPPMPVPRARQLAAPPPDFVLDERWGLIFADEFETPSFDTTKWWTRYLYNDGMLDYLNDEWQRYRESDNHPLGTGQCALTALPHNGEFWPSGLGRSKPLFPLADGQAYYFEARGQVPAGKGCWPAFWLAGSEREPGNDQTAYWPPEIDPMEIVNNGSDDTTYMLHVNAQVLDWGHNPQQYAGTWYHPDFNTQWNYWYAPFDFAAGKHSWSLLYKRPQAVVYCDRKPIRAFIYDWVNDDRQPAPPAHLFVNLAIGGSWAGRYGVDETAFPQSFDLEYIRVYRQVTPLPQSVIGHDLM